MAGLCVASISLHEIPAGTPQHPFPPATKFALLSIPPHLPLKKHVCAAVVDKADEGNGRTVAEGLQLLHEVKGPLSDLSSVAVLDLSSVGRVCPQEWSPRQMVQLRANCL